MRQTGIPLRVLTSGVEREAATPFCSSGKWRFVERVRWWNEYRDRVPVVVGHYWRWAEGEIVVDDGERMETIGLAA